MTPHGAFHWNELITKDVDGAKKFYTEVLGWTTEEFPMPTGDYTVVKSGDTPVGGIFDMAQTEAPDGTPSHWAAYVAVDDVDAACAKVTAAGGQVMMPPFDVPEVGRIAMIFDNTGALLGLITPVEETA